MRETDTSKWGGSSRLMVTAPKQGSVSTSGANVMRAFARTCEHMAAHLRYKVRDSVGVQVFSATSS